MTYTQQVAKHCRDLHPEAATDSDAVFAYQKDLQKLIDLKKVLNLPAKEEIELWFELLNCWNELKALELKPELEYFIGGENVADNNCGNCSCNNPLVLVGDQTCGTVS